MESVMTEPPHPDWPLQTVGRLWVIQGPPVDDMYAMVKQQTSAGVTFSLDPRFEPSEGGGVLRGRDFVDLFLPWKSFAFQPLNEQSHEYFGRGLGYLAWKVVENLCPLRSWRAQLHHQEIVAVFKSLGKHWSNAAKLRVVSHAYFCSRKDGNNHRPSPDELVAIFRKSVAHAHAPDLQSGIIPILLGSLSLRSGMQNVITELGACSLDREILFDFWHCGWFSTFVQAQQLMKAMAALLPTEQIIGWIGQTFGARSELRYWSAAIAAEVIRRIKKLPKEEQQPFKDLLLDGLGRAVNEGSWAVFPGRNEVARLFGCEPDELFRKLQTRKG